GAFLRTGDLGFLNSGELFVTGRLKDLIILRGRNHYPQDIERTAEASHPALRPGSGAAFSVEREGEERLVVVQEIEHERRAPGELEAIAEAARRAVAEEHEVAVEEVVLLRSGTILKTSSGKVRRRACREAYLAGELVVVGRSLAEAAVPASGLREEVAGILRLPPDAVEPDRPLVALGLDSLAAVELKGRVEERFGVSLSLAALLEGATLEDVAAEIGRGGGSLSRVAGEGWGGGLTLNQRALWFVERLSPGSYNLAGAARIRGGLDPEALRRAFQALADRHPALRTTFEEQDGEPVRRVHERMEVDFGASADDLLAPFDLQRGPLMRVRLSDGVLSLGIHHLAADFRSLAILLRELGTLYRGESLAPASDPIPREDTSEASWTYWRETLAGDLPVLDLATDRPRPPVQTYAGASRALRLEGERVRAWASESGATLHTALLAAFHALLHRYTGQPDILVGVPTSGHGEAVGYFVNPVVVRADLAGEPTAAELLARVKTAALGALEHSGFPFPLLAERLQPE
ncbi:MAG: condensation domain-containing protein, partial [Thermoanaerobaculia bacterium]